MLLNKSHVISSCSEFYQHFRSSFWTNIINVIKAKLYLEKSCANYFCTKTALKMLVKLTFGSNFTNLLAQSANAPSENVLRCPVSPTKLCPTLPVNTTRIYIQLLCFMLYNMSQIRVNLMV